MSCIWETILLGQSQLIMSTGVGNCKHISLVASYVPSQHTGGGWGSSRACLVTLVILQIGTMVFALVVALPPYPYPFPSLLVLWQQIWVTLHHLHHMMLSPWCWQFRPQEALSTILEMPVVQVQTWGYYHASSCGPWALKWYGRVC